MKSNKRNKENWIRFLHSTMNRGVSLRANYTERATAACRQN
jgi:hypothetical protein